jgi:hypothetical protein
MLVCKKQEPLEAVPGSERSGIEATQKHSGLLNSQLRRRATFHPLRPEVVLLRDFKLPENGSIAMQKTERYAERLVTLDHAIDIEPTFPRPLLFHVELRKIPIYASA